MITAQKHEYSYEGPVMHFDSYVMSHWSASTYAPTAAKARSNLIYRFKKEYDYDATAKISLPGELTRLCRKGK